MLRSGLIEYGGAFSGLLPGETEMHIGRRVQADAGMAVFVIVSGSGRVHEISCMVDRGEALGPQRPVLEGLEKRFRIGVVVRYPGP